MGKALQTFERRQLGLALRRLRNEAGKSQQAAADHVGKARSRVAELEDGRTTLTADELGTLLSFYGVSVSERRTVLELGVLAKTRQKKRAHTDLLPGSFQRFADLEENATEINCYEFGIIPGLLQSLGYVRATIDDGDGIWWEPSVAEIQERISFRLDRQAKTLDSDKKLRFVITEDAVRGAVGSPEVMHEQRRHILKLLESNQNLTVQVLRTETYRNPARGAGLTVLLFGERGAPVGFSTVVVGSSTYFDQEADTTALLRGFHRVQELALSPKDSVRFIEEVDHA
ncbi:MAG TPA: helix-turn-helix transcriptional regulator [Actinophytocola sp.]|jgi:transcriptional regulator with XRE-family HTH domain|nr:helix-turn-helix transcriptional regulator [Actinophytocola sp.]